MMLTKYEHPEPKRTQPNPVGPVEPELLSDGTMFVEMLLNAFSNRCAKV
jgi:hypothetical protein